MRYRRANFALLCLVVLGLAGAFVVWQFRGYLTRENLEYLLQSFAAMGPLPFFSLMAVLPLFFIPVSPFLLLSPVFGLELAVFGSAGALSLNLLVSWFVSGKWFRPFFSRVVARYGYSIPVLSGRKMIGVAVMLRITPGVPFPLQNYLLGLANMPLIRYLAISLPIVWLTSSSFILLGGSVMTGNFKLAAIGLCLAIAIALGLRYWRMKMQANQVMEAEVK